MRRTIFIDPNGKRGMSGELFEAGDSPNGATVLLPHIWGLDADMAAHAERLAATGTRVLVPDLFWRDGRDALDRNDASQREAAATRLRAFDVDAGIADMSVAIEFLRALARPGGPITALGYCFGGRFVFTAAARGEIAAGAAFHPTGIGEHLADMGRIACPLTLHFGGADEMVPMTEVEEIRTRAASIPNVMIFVHAGAGHGFTIERHRHYAPQAAAAAWTSAMSVIHDPAMQASASGSRPRHAAD